MNMLPPRPHNPHREPAHRESAHPEFAHPENDDAPVSLQFVLHIARRWWWRAGLMGLVVGAAFAGMGYALWQPRWEATAWLKVDPTFIFKTDHFDSLAFSRSQLELFKSPAVLEKALEKPEVVAALAQANAADPIAWVRKRLTTSVMGESQVFVVTMTCESRELPHPIVNAIVDSYMNFTTAEADERQRMRLEGMDARLAALKTTIKDLADRWSTLAKKAGHIATPGAADPTVQKVGALTTQLAFVNAELTRLRAQLETKQRFAGGRKPSADVDPEALRTATAKCAEELAVVDRELQSLPASSRIRRGELEPKRGELAARLRDLQADAAAATAAAEIAGLKTSVEQNEAQQRTLMDQLSTEAGRLEGNRDLLLEMETINRKLQNEQALELQVANERAKEAMEGAVKRVHKMQDAKPPRSRLEDGGPMRRALMFGAVGFLLPAAFLFAREWFVRPIGSAEDLSRAVLVGHVGEVAAVPRLADRRQDRRLRIEHGVAESSRYQDSVDYLRVSLLANRAPNEIRTIVVASAEEGEGKSTLATNLARSLADSTAGRVLLVDADLRRPSLHGRLHLPSSPGVADCLVGRAFPEAALQPTDLENMDFLPSGSNLGNPAMLFSESRFAHLLERLHGKFDFVIVDTPPVLAFGEAIVAGLAADGAILCALRDRSNAAAVAKARTRLEASGVRILAAVLNNAPSSHSTNSYYYRRRPEDRMPATRPTWRG